MKYNCKIIEDLLPLYSDEVCSEESRKIVEEHLQECEECRALIDETREVSFARGEKEEPVKTDVVKKGFKKIRRRWIASLIAVFMLIPLICLGTLAYNESQDAGVAFSNLDEIHRCFKFLHYIEDGKYDKASELVDYTKNDYKLVESVAHMTPEEYQAYMQKRFVEKLQEYDALGLSIENIRFDSAYRRSEDGIWTICVSYDEVYPDGKKQTIVAHIDGETMYAGAYSYPEKGKTERDDYIDTILCLYSEDEASWYQDYQITFELKEGEKAIIRRDPKSDVEIDGIFNITYGTGTGLIDEPYYQNVFETSVPGSYSVFSFGENGQLVFLSSEEIDIEIVKYSK